MFLYIFLMLACHAVSPAGRCLQHHDTGSTPGVQLTEDVVQQSSGNYSFHHFFNCPLYTCSRTSNYFSWSKLCQTCFLFHIKINCPTENSWKWWNPWSVNLSFKFSVVMFTLCALDVSRSHITLVYGAYWTINGLQKLVTKSTLSRSLKVKGASSTKVCINIILRGEANTSNTV